MTKTDTGRTLYKRTLYEIRHYPYMGSPHGARVGWKGRLVPLKAARRIAKRLKSRGLDVEIGKYAVQLTPGQRDYLDARYGA
jgi:hypothetical protein